MGKHIKVTLTDKAFRDTLGAVSAFCIYEDADGIHNAGVKASSALFYNGALSGKNPTAIWAIGAGVTGLSTFLYGKSSLKRIFAESWDVSKIVTLANAFNNTSLQQANLTKWDTSALTSCNGIFSGCSKLETIGLFPIPSGCSTTTLFNGCEKLANIYFADGAKVFVSLLLNYCPLTYQSVCNVFDALADTPDAGATITFKSGLYVGFTEEQKAVIDAKRNAAVANGWTIANMS